MKKITFFFLSLFSVYSFAQTPLEKGLASINRQDAITYISVLANDSLQGREAGTEGGLKAAEYIKSLFEETGIKPWRGKYYQTFSSSANFGGPQQNHAEMRNVLGYIPGKNTDEVVIIGAHYDHLGTHANNTNDSIYNGADDNASGTSAILQIAKAFAATEEKPERTVIFALWDGEEKGLLGSFHFVEDHLKYLPIPQINPITIKGYINCDMIGRNKDGDTKHVAVFVSPEKPIFNEWIKNDIEKYSLNLTPEFRTMDEQAGGSDHMPFMMKGVPIIFYITDLHEDYHQPSDHTEKINFDKVTEIAKLSFLNLWNMANEN